MLGRALISVTLLTATASAADFLLGLDYSEWLPPNVTQISTDSAGAIYVLSSFPISGSTPPSTVTKLSSDGRSVLWQNPLGFAASTMAVDPRGGVYVTPVNIAGAISVVSLRPDGAGILWSKSTELALPFGFLPALAVDADGRTYVAGFEASRSGAVVARVNASGTGIDYVVRFPGMPSSIAVDASGAAFIAGSASAGMFLQRLAPDGSPGFYSIAPRPSLNPTVALDSSGNAVVYSSGVLNRFDRAGALISSRIVADWALSYPGFALDAAGNAYVAGSSATRFYPVRNTLASCGTELLSVIAPDGSVLQTTYLAGGERGALLLVAVGRGGSILLAGPAGSAFAPTRTGPFTSGSRFLAQLSTNAAAQPLSLACTANGASFTLGSIAPGQVVTLFGSGLGPAQGVGIPALTEAANIQVTFDGIPAKLLYLQEGQVNLVSPPTLSPGRTTNVCVSYNGNRTNCLELPVVETSPGVFTTDGQYATAYNEDGRRNTAANPAAPNSIVSVFATGLGGSIPPMSVELVTPGGSPLGPGNLSLREITFAGQGDGLVEGVSQINFRVGSASGQYALRLPATRSQSFLIYVAPQ